MCYPKKLDVVCTIHKLFDKLKKIKLIQARIAQLVAYWLGTREVPGSNPGKGESFSMKINIVYFVSLIGTCILNKFFIILISACLLYILPTRLFLYNR